nr:aminopeptidase N [Spelaeicoccus albus]
MTRQETSERAAHLAVSDYTVRIDVSNATDPHAATYSSRTSVRFTSDVEWSPFIDLIAPDVERVTLNGADLAPGDVFDGARVNLPGVRAGENHLEVHARAAYSRTGEGLHRFVDPADGQTYLYTQYEPTDARRVFANFDQPDLKAKFAFDVTAPAGWLVLSNSPTPEPVDPESADAGSADGDSPDGVRRYIFAPTRLQSSYITCLAAGPYVRRTDTWTSPGDDSEGGEPFSIELGVSTRRSLAEYMEAEEIFAVTKAGLDFFHRMFGVPYPWGKYDQIFVPEYNLGAMENPGLVTFTDDYIFHAAVTDNQHEARANTIMHEMAHMWFGDLVTMVWWDDLWLKESFADFMGALAVVESTQWTDAWVTFATKRKAWAYRQDQLPTTHPIVADIEDVEAAKLNFDGITYAKGAAVLRQLVAYVGRDEFFDGARRYFRDHAWGNTRLADFLAALDAAAPERQVEEWATAWLQTAGISTLTPEIAETDGVIDEFAIRQSGEDPRTGEPGLRPHRIAIGCYSLVGGSLARTDRVEVDVRGERTVVAQLAGMRRPDLVIVNDDDLTYAKVRLDDVSLATVRRHFDAVADAMPRSLVWSMLWNAIRDALMPASDFLELFDNFAFAETNSGVRSMLHGQAITALDAYVPGEYRPVVAADLLGSALAAVRADPAGSDAQLLDMLFVVRMTGRITPDHPSSSAADARALLSGLLRMSPDQDAGQAAGLPGLKVDSELRWAILTALAATGHADVDEIDAEAAADRTGAAATHAVQARASRPLPVVKARAWAAAVESDELSNDHLSATIAGFTHPSGRHLLDGYVDQYFGMVEDIWASRSIEIARRIVRGLYPSWAPNREDALTRTRAWLDGHPDAPASLRRLIIEDGDDLARSVRAAALLA